MLALATHPFSTTVSIYSLIGEPAPEFFEAASCISLLNVCLIHSHEASGLGAAINAAVGINLYPDYKTAIKEMTHTGKVFEPNPDVQKIYDGLYKNVYKRMYSKLRPLYKSIREITREKDNG